MICKTMLWCCLLALGLGLLAVPGLSAEDKKLDIEDKINASQLIIVGKVTAVRDSCQPDRKLALVEGTEKLYEGPEFEKVQLRKKVYVSFLHKMEDKKLKGPDLKTGQQHIFFLTRPGKIGEFFPVDDLQGIEASGKGRIAEVQSFLNLLPVCGRECGSKAPDDGGPGKCAACGRATKSKAFVSCNTCTLKSKKCRVCGKAFKNPWPAERVVKIKAPIMPELRKIEEIDTKEYLAADQKALTTKVDAVIGLRKLVSEGKKEMLFEVVLDIEGDAVTERSFFNPQGEEWAGIKALRPGKSKVKVFVREADTEGYLERELEVEVK